MRPSLGGAPGSPGTQRISCSIGVRATQNQIMSISAIDLVGIRAAKKPIVSITSLDAVATSVAINVIASRTGIDVVIA